MHTCGLVYEIYSCLYFVDILSASPTGAGSLQLYVFRVDLDINIIHLPGAQDTDCVVQLRLRTEPSHVVTSAMSLVDNTGLHMCKLCLRASLASCNGEAILTLSCTHLQPSYKQHGSSRHSAMVLPVSMPWA